MTTFTLLAGVIALIAIAATLLMAVRDGRGPLPAPRSHATDPDMVPPGRRTTYRG